MIGKNDRLKYFKQGEYDNCSILSKCENVVLEAKRVLLNEQIDKIVSITLSDLNVARQSTTETHETAVMALTSTYNSEITSLENVLNIDTHIFMKNEKLDNFASLKKYFNKWMILTKSNKQEQLLIEKHIEEESKVDQFINKLKIKQKAKSANQDLKVHKNGVQKRSKSENTFKNRFCAQKTIIEIQKAKLDEQNKIIEELKLGIIREDLMKSIENGKTNIREIFANCSERLKNKVPLIIQAEERDKFMVATQKAPKIIQKMEQRAIERANKRHIILERKRFIEETRKKLLEEAIEKKKTLEEEERKRALEIIKERRKKELELEKIKQEKRLIFMEALNKAIQFHNYILLKQCWQKLFNNYINNKHNFNFSKKYYDNKILQNIVRCWLGVVEEKYKIKYEIADAQFEYKILKTSICNWKMLHIENKRNMQVAEDLYDFRLLSNAFICWHRYVCSQITIIEQKYKIAEIHNNRRMLFQYFYQWRSLPVVIQLERAKEEKKRKWREKVWELLPDYRPPVDV